MVLFGFKQGSWPIDLRDEEWYVLLLMLRESKREPEAGETSRIKQLARGSGEREKSIRI